MLWILFTLLALATGLEYTPHTQEELTGAIDAVIDLEISENKDYIVVTDQRGGTPDVMVFKNNGSAYELWDDLTEGAVAKTQSGINSDGTFLVTADAVFMRVYTKSGGHFQSPTDYPTGNPVTSIEFGYTGTTQYIVEAIQNSAVINVYSYNSGTGVFDAGQVITYLSSTDFSGMGMAPNMQYLAFGSGNPYQILVYYFDGVNFQFFQNLAEPTTHCTIVRMAGDSSLIAAGCGGTVFVYQFGTTFTFLTSFSDPDSSTSIKALHIVDSGKYLLVGGSLSTRIHIFARQSDNSYLLEGTCDLGSTDYVRSAALSSDESLLVVGTSTFKVFLFSKVEASSSSSSSSFWLIVGLSIAGAVLLVCLIAILIICLARRREDEQNQAQQKHQPVQNEKTLSESDSNIAGYTPWQMALITLNHQKNGRRPLQIEQFSDNSSDLIPPVRGRVGSNRPMNQRRRTLEDIIRTDDFRE